MGSSSHKNIFALINFIAQEQVAPWTETRNAIREEWERTMPEVKGNEK